jgi:15-cis-phytoene synthase
MNDAQQLFKKSSKTYYYSAIFFPRSIRKDIFTLYAFVRTADNLVDEQQDIEAFLAFKENYHKEIGNKIITDFIELKKRKKFPELWITAFLEAMEQDFQKKEYETYKELQQYMHGSAEVIGLMMAKIIGLSEKSYIYAMKQGEAMQLINFIRDIKEDNQLGRRYIPKEYLNRFGLESLKEEEVKQKREQYKQLTQFIINKYFSIQKQAEKGYTFIPRKNLIPIKTAAQMYNWTARQIQQKPSIVYIRKVKPTKLRVIKTILRNAIWKN